MSRGRHLRHLRKALMNYDMPETWLQLSNKIK